MPEKPVPSQRGLSEALLDLYDAYSDHHAYCAFFCDAVAALSANREEWLDERSAQGLCLFSQWIKERSETLKGELEMAWQVTKAPAESFGRA